MSSSDSRPEHLPGARWFATTRWSVVLAAGRKSSAAAEDAARALETLCSTYWYPLYAYVRRRGHDAEAARDLTQSFFAHILEKGALVHADRERGKFRSFLLASLNHHLSSQWRRDQALKRGGGRSILSLDFEDGERRYQIEPSHEQTAERIFDRRWAMTLLETAIARLGDEYEAAGKGPLFEALKITLGAGAGHVRYQEIGASLGMSEGAIKVAVHRLRRRCRETLRDEIAQTVSHPDEIEGELRYLFEALRG